MNYNIIYDLKADDLSYLRELLGWKKIKKEQLEKGLKNTEYKITIKNDIDIIAIGRVVTDYSCKGLLSDIIVNPKYQKQGFGKIVVTSLINMIQNSLKEGDLFQLEAAPTNGNRDFYVNCGMKYKPENQDGTYIWLKGE